MIGVLSIFALICEKIGRSRQLPRRNEHVPPRWRSHPLLIVKIITIEERRLRHNKFLRLKTISETFGSSKKVSRNKKELSGNSRPN